MMLSHPPAAYTPFHNSIFLSRMDGNMTRRSTVLEESLFKPLLSCLLVPPYCEADRSAAIRQRQM